MIVCKSIALQAVGLAGCAGKDDLRSSYCERMEKPTSNM